MMGITYMNWLDFHGFHVRKNIPLFVPWMGITGYVGYYPVPSTCTWCITVNRWGGISNISQNPAMALVY